MSRFFLPWLGLVLCVPALLARPIVLNPSFEDGGRTLSAQTVWGPITNWNGVGRTAICPDMFGNQHLITNGRIPDGTNTAVIYANFPKNTSPHIGNLSQTINGFEAGKSYVVCYHGGVRNGPDVCVVKVSLNSEIIDGPELIQPVEPAGSFEKPFARRISREFYTATGGSFPLTFFVDMATDNGDEYLLLDHVRIWELGSLKLTSARRFVQNATRVTARFSAELSPESFANPLNFSINDTPVLDAQPGEDDATVLLTTSAPLDPQAENFLTVYGITDTDGRAMFFTNATVQISFVPILPVDFERSYNGFQDDFIRPPRSFPWVSFGSGIDNFRPGYGILKAASDSNSTAGLVVQMDPGGNQEILAKIRVTQPAAGGRAGIGFLAGSDQDLALVLRDDFSGEIQQGSNTLSRLNNFEWATNQWYWLRLSLQEGGSGLEWKAAVWPADGDTPEPLPVSGQITSIPGKALPGFIGSSSEGRLEWEIDYFLLKRQDQPSIAPTPPAPIPVEVLEIGIREGWVTVSWPESLRDFILERTESLLGPWLPAPGERSLSQGRFSVTTPATSSAMFYRLRY